jgi:hypothetical protein
MHLPFVPRPLCGGRLRYYLSLHGVFPQLSCVPLWQRQCSRLARQEGIRYNFSQCFLLYYEAKPLTFQVLHEPDDHSASAL